MKLVNQSLVELLFNVVTSFIQESKKGTNLLRSENEYFNQRNPWNCHTWAVLFIFFSMSLLYIMIRKDLCSILFLSYLFIPIKLCLSFNPKFEACQAITWGNQTIIYPFYIQDRQEYFCGYPSLGTWDNQNRNTGKTFRRGFVRIE